MGPVFVILLWLFLAAVAGGIRVGCLALFLRGRRQGSRLAMWLSGVPLLVMPALGLACAGLVAFNVVRSAIPRYVYEDTFHAKPAADVQDLQSHVWSFADSSEAFLRFQAGPETVHRVLPGMMRRVSYAEYRRMLPSNNLKPPAWWQPPTEATSEIYLSLPKPGRKGDQAAFETKLMTYDASTRTAMYYSLGVD